MQFENPARNWGKSGQTAQRENKQIKTEEEIRKEISIFPVECKE